MKLALLSVLFVAAVAYPAGDFTLTMDILDKLIERIQKNSDKVPKLMMEQITSATDEEKQQFIDVINKMHKGEITQPVSSLADLVRLLEEHAPAVGKKAKVVYDDYLERYAKLTPQAQQFLTRWESKWFELSQKAKTDKQACFKEIVALGPVLLEEIKGFSPETWKSFEEHFPEQYTIWNENRQRFEKFSEILSHLPKDMDLTENPQAFQKLMQVNLENFLPVEALKA